MIKRLVRPGRSIDFFSQDSTTMDHTIFTPRLKLTLVTTAERGSLEFEWLHQLRSDEKASFWR